MALARAPADPKGWRTFTRKFEAEMRAPAARQFLDLLAALSRQVDLSVGCCRQEGSIWVSLRIAGRPLGGLAEAAAIGSIFATVAAH